MTTKTKIEHINLAYKWLVISGITTKPSPSELEDGLELLEDMMYEFQSRNICSSYVFEEEPSPNTDAEVEPAYNNAVSTNLAVRLANFFGKEAMQTTKQQATQSLSNWSARSSRVNQISPPNRQPMGSGNTFRSPKWVRYYRYKDNAPISCETFGLKVGQTDSFSVDFSNYLFEDATITEYTVEADNGITIDSHAESGGVVTMVCTGKASGYSAVTITVTTSNGRVNPQKVNFNITDS